MKGLDCGRLVTWGLVGGLLAWAIFIPTAVYAMLFVPDVPAHAGSAFTQRGGVQAGGFIAGWWIALAGLASCVIGYVREYRGLRCLIAVVPAALYAANPWSVMVFVKFAGG